MRAALFGVRLGREVAALRRGEATPDHRVGVAPLALLSGMGFLLLGAGAVSLNPERMLAIYPVFAWFEIAERLEGGGDGALALAIRAAMNGRWLGDDGSFDLTDDERARVQAAVAE